MLTGLVREVVGKGLNEIWWRVQVAKGGGGVSAANQVAYLWAQNLGKATPTDHTHHPNV